MANPPLVLSRSWSPSDERILAYRVAFNSTALTGPSHRLKPLQFGFPEPVIRGTIHHLLIYRRRAHVVSLVSLSRNEVPVHWPIASLIELPNALDEILKVRVSVTSRLEVDQSTSERPRAGIRMLLSEGFSASS